MTYVRTLSILLNPSILWLSLLPIMVWSEETCPGESPYPYLMSGGLLVMFGLLQGLFRIHFRNLYALLPLLFIIPLHKVVLHNVVERWVQPTEDYSAPLLLLGMVVASVWGISSVRTCEMTKHPTCREILFTNYLMGGKAMLYFIVRLLLPSLAEYDSVVMPVATLGVWVAHAVRIAKRPRGPRCPIPSSSDACDCTSEVRIAIVRGQEVWLAPTVDGKQYDLPFSTCIREGEDRHIAIERLRKDLPRGMTPKFLLRYNTDDNDGGHSVFLYVVNLGTECPPPEIESGGGFRSSKSIAQDLDSGLFTAMFAEEYQYLRHTILLANSIVSKRKCDHC